MPAYIRTYVHTVHTVHTVHAVHLCMLCTPYCIYCTHTVHTVRSVHTVHTVHTIHTVYILYSTHCTIHTVHTVHYCTVPYRTIPRTSIGNKQIGNRPIFQTHFCRKSQTCTPVCCFVLTTHLFPNISVSVTRTLFCLNCRFPNCETQHHDGKRSKSALSSRPDPIGDQNDVHSQCI